mmetsp:Transcript_30670/g.54837  ORF Transcript_30670/g.54837 Transcript_30670/m.54837 type:complete len:283 (+) Transcript_30670:141-989(+)
MTWSILQSAQLTSFAHRTTRGCTSGQRMEAPTLPAAGCLTSRPGNRSGFGSIMQWMPTVSRWMFLRKSKESCFTCLTLSLTLPSTCIRNTKIGPRQSMQKGSDYSIYYLALNNTLNHDDGPSLECAFPLIRHMVFRLLYTTEFSRKVQHPGGRVWKGDSESPVPINMQKLKEAFKEGTVVRFRQFQSTTSDEKVAERFKRRGDSRGYLWTIDIPEGFWGARNIQNVAWKQHETETLFPPYSAFLVQSVDGDSCHLRAVEKYCDCKLLSGLDPMATNFNSTLT